MKTSRALALLTGAWLLGASPAQANGRFPGARQIALGTTDPATMLLRTTFGQMLSHDGGKSFHWVCEQVIGYGGTQDPAIAITADDTLVNTAYEGTSLSHDGGCSWSFADGLDGRYSVDIALDPTDTAHALVIVAADATHQLDAQCWETVDDGHHWAVRSELPAGFFPQNVDLARSRPGRVYLTGLQTQADGNPHATVLRSDDGGATWVARPVPVETGRSVFLSAIDPADEGLLYARAEGTASDALLRSTDGGDTFTSLIELPGGMLGFALSPDGSRVAIGGPSGGVLVASRSDGVFTAQSATPVTCLTWGPEGLYACGVDELASGFAMARSDDEGVTFTPLLAALGDTCGPLTSCGASSDYVAACPALWPSISATLSTSVPPDPAGPACGQAGGPSGAGGSSSGAGGAGGAGTSGVAGASTAAPPAGGSDESGGGCQATAGGPNICSLHTWIVVAAGLFCRHPRRRARRATT